MEEGLKVDLTFEHDYEVKPIDTLAASDKALRLYFPKEAEVSDEQNVSIRVEPYGYEPWVGIFAGDYGDHDAISVVASCPNRSQLCVVAGGDGYFVLTNQPTNWRKAEPFPIRDVIPVPAFKLLVLADETEIVAYGVRGLVWRTGRLASDDLKISNVTATSLRGSAWDASHGHEVEFEVDILTGKVSGGIQYLPREGQS